MDVIRKMCYTLKISYHQTSNYSKYLRLESQMVSESTPERGFCQTEVSNKLCPIRSVGFGKFLTLTSYGCPYKLIS